MIFHSCFSSYFSDALQSLGELSNAMGVIGMDGELDGKKPNFVTPGQTYRIVAGATVVLPCRVTETGKLNYF